MVIKDEYFFVYFGGWQIGWAWKWGIRASFFAGSRDRGKREKMRCVLSSQHAVAHSSCRGVGEEEKRRTQRDGERQHRLPRVGAVVARPQLASGTGFLPVPNPAIGTSTCRVQCRSRNGSDLFTRGALDPDFSAFVSSVSIVGLIQFSTLYASAERMSLQSTISSLTFLRLSAALTLLRLRGEAADRSVVAFLTRRVVTWTIRYPGHERETCR